MKRTIRVRKHRRKGKIVKAYTRKIKKNYGNRVRFNEGSKRKVLSFNGLQLEPLTIEDEKKRRILERIREKNYGSSHYRKTSPELKQLLRKYPGGKDMPMREWMGTPEGIREQRSSLMDSGESQALWPLSKKEHKKLYGDFV